MNPYAPAKPEHPVNTNDSSGARVLTWSGHTLSVTAAMIPRFLPLLGAFHVSVDSGSPMSSSQLRWQERFEFVIAENGRDVPATFEAHGFAIGRQPFRILIDGVLVF